MTDMFETSRFASLENKIEANENERHEEVMREMREAIDKNENIGLGAEPVIRRDFAENNATEVKPEFDSPAVVTPNVPVEKPVENFEEVSEKRDDNMPKKPVSRSIMELANNPDFSVATIAKEANRINRKDEGEVFISLH